MWGQSSRVRCLVIVGSILTSLWGQSSRVRCLVIVGSVPTGPVPSHCHWLPVQAGIDYKLSTICHSFLSDSSPAYFSDLLTVYIPSRQLRSSADTQILRIPHARTYPFCQRCFSFCAPKKWNSLPSDIHHIQTSYAFKTVLKTHLYKHVILTCLPYLPSLAPC